MYQMFAITVDLLTAVFKMTSTSVEGAVAAIL